MAVKKLFFLFFLLIILVDTKAQTAKTFTRADSLRGTLTPLRSCFDVKFYHLDVKIDPEEKSIQGSNTIVFQVVEPFSKFQIDLFSNLEIDSILHKGSQLKYKRDINAVFVEFPILQNSKAISEIAVFYHGKPTAAERAPWDGGFVWSKDQNGDPWIGVACEGIGASSWWPNKDHLSDEPDSALISVTVPKGLTDVSNGRLISEAEIDSNWTKFDWFVSYPINNYNITVNIAKYEHIRDYYINSDTLTLDYFVLPGNVAKAKKHFQMVKPMMACFEKYLGKYPFYRDGYKLVESSYLGMEHQSAIAYGNKYLPGYLGTDRSRINLDFDYIIVHETGHEWWGNNVSCSDIADMWIHESFCTYSETFYVECRYGKETARNYVMGQKLGIKNKAPMRGHYGVNEEGDADMYLKGSVVLNTLRNVINNDSLWFGIIKGIQKDFALKTISKTDIVNYINQKTGKNFTYFFDQYFDYPNLPVLQVRLQKKRKGSVLNYRWKADVKDFAMPVKVTVNSRDTMNFIYPTEHWQKMRVKVKIEDFKVNDQDFYFIVEK